ncbi:DUF5675 family protein [Parapedobacter soli]|uniref:DUF5675 family protein n=1 Tax=Parapedobacter soli TaxID=416955 RepID=UPI0021C7F5C9|nr:DUF5675 family protein [Parapedobacter soli]
MNETRIIRVAQGKHSTLSHLYIGGLFCCYLLEDRIRDEKIAGETCIPPGDYGLSLNLSATMHTEYAKRFPRLHKGMVEIVEIPNFRLVFVHIGNYHHETWGCPLTGLYWQWLDGDYQVKGSQTAYEFVYPMLVAEIKKGNDRLVVENRLPHDDGVQAP